MHKLALFNRSAAAFALVVFGGLAPSLHASQSLKGHVLPELRGLKSVGTPSQGARMQLAIGLPLRNQEALTNLLEQLYDPASPQYRQFLTSDQFAAQFGPTEEDYNQLIQWATSKNLTITEKYSNRVILGVSGTVDEIEKAFNTSIKLYPHPSEKRNFYAPDSEPSLELNTRVLHISGLDNYFLPRPASLVRQSRSHPVGGQPKDAQPMAGSGPGGSYMGKDFRAAYAPGVTLSGVGQYVGLVQFDGYYASDIAAYVSQSGLTNVPLINVLLDGVTGIPSANSGAVTEVSLDIEMAISMAPGLAGVIVYEGRFGNSILNRMATDNLAKQLSASWTFGADLTTAQIFLQFAAQGQSYFNASGDSGAYTASTTIPTPVDFVNITCVGGTTLATRGPASGYVSETIWNWWSIGGSGASSGGTSVRFAIPSWQQPIMIGATNGGSTTFRNIPDVAMVSDNVFVRSNNGQTESVGGDSVATPLWAGFLALCNEQAKTLGQSSIGFINPAIYALAQTTNYTNAFHDIKTGNNTNPSSPSQFFAVAGYDLCTGLGTPAGKALINALAPPANARVVVAASSTLALETCSGTNGVIDPGEAVAVNLALQNIGGVNTTNLVATLQSSGGVTPLSSPQTYGSLVGGGVAVSKSFTFIANGVCGGTINPTLQLQDGTTNLGTVSFTLPLGVFQGVLTQNFDGVVAPALPAGWTSAISGGASNWVTSTTLRDSLPNSAFAFESTNIGVAELLSPSVPIATTSAVLSFRNNYNFEMNSTNPAYDGGVLEISIGGGPFTDIVAAGGSFASGGYTRTIGPTDPLAQNPLDGRQAWAGISGGFVSTVVNLPAAASGQTVQFKWRLGTDLGNDWGGLGWYIDSVSVKDGYACCTPATTNDLGIVQNEAPNPGTVGQGISYTLIANNVGPAPAPALVITDSLPANVTVVFISPGCTNIGGTIVCRSPLLLSGGTTNFTVIVTPNVPGNFTNIVSVSSLANDSNLANNWTTNIVPVFAPLVPPTILLNSLTLSGGVFSLSLNSVSGLNYSLEYKNNLTDSTWTPVLPVVAGNGGPVILQDTNAPLPISRFYRVNCF